MAWNSWFALPCLSAAVCLLSIQCVGGTLTKLADMPAPQDALTPTPGLTLLGRTLFGTAADGAAGGRGAVFGIDLFSGHETLVHVFTGGADGGLPQAPLTAANGLLYGTTTQGGAAGHGTLFAVDPADGSFTTLFAFPADWGAASSAPLLAYGDALYGTTINGGRRQDGLVFAYAAGQGTILHSFARSDGASPESGLMQFGGRLFGTTTDGGANEAGTLYALDPTGHNFATLHVFTNGADGGFPRAGLTAYHGALYGSTLYGGTYDYGGVFRLDAVSGTVSSLYSFAGGADGCNPNAVLPGRGGLLFGTTSNCGQQGGTIFSLDPDSGQETTVFTFGGGRQGQNTRTSLIEAGGRLFGTAPTGSTEFASRYQGNVFSVDPAQGHFVVLHDFEGGLEGGRNSALIASGSTFYGTNENGGAFGFGTVFRADPVSGASSTLYTFQGGVDGALPSGALVDVGGKLYGATYEGGVQGGTLYEIDPPTGLKAILYDFHTGIDGHSPQSPLALLHGALYGATGGGGFFCGAIFRFDLALHEFQLLDTLLDNDICGTAAGFAVSRGLLYGVSSGSSNYHGNLYSFDPSNDTATTILDFYGNRHGSFPVDTPLVLGRQIYLTTYYGAKHTHHYNPGVGAVIRIDARTGRDHVLHYFVKGTDGIYPVASLTRFGNTLYGVTTQGGSANQGVLFSIGLLNDSYTLLHSFDGDQDGGMPTATLLNWQGALYGTTNTGGVGNRGTIFKFVP